MSISEASIEELRNSVDIVEVIGKEVRLLKKGKSYKGVCPFHSEKTPSFTVNLEKGLYYCFGCHKGGDTIKFVMEFYKYTYVEAIEMLAEKFGIKIIRTFDKIDSIEENEKLFGALEFAANLFKQQLLETEEGKNALEYLKSRKLNIETIDTFKLGYSLKSWDGLIHAAEVEGISSENLLKLGLIRKREDETLYDTFRGRVMYPIHSSMGRIIGFGARKMFDDDPLGKYINSSDSTIYQKSKILYGLSFAKEEIRQKNSALLVEGYMDFLALYEAGFKNVVATSGTALTLQQIQLLSRFTTNIFFVYDGDSAGSTAMLRGIDLILQSGLDVRIVELASGYDPDSFIKEKGSEEFSNLISKGVSFIDFKANKFQEEGKFNSAEGRAEVVRDIVSTISKIKDPLRQTFFIKDVAQKYSLYESTLMTELEKISRSQKNEPRINIPIDTRTEDYGGELQIKTDTKLKVSQSIPSEEKEILSAILEDPQKVCSFVFSQIHTEDFTHATTKKIAETIFHLMTEGEEISFSKLYNLLDDEVLKLFISELGAMQYQLGSEWEKIGSRLSEERLINVAFGGIKKMKIKILEDQRDKNQEALKDAIIKNVDTTQFLLIHKEILQKIKEIQNLQMEK